MRIILTENDIKKALIAYTSTLGLDLANHHVQIELTAGRGANGHSATVIIDEADDTKDLVGTSATSIAPQAVIKPQAKVVEAPEPILTGTLLDSDGEVEIPVATPETAGHESSEKVSLFD